ncbi:MAG TPA: polyprenol monophosphomannose synthase [Anaerolineales bacterium]|nr:polyprenol monophosphomannose synthase [Anaerolineales bacterium]HRF46401.1 polyprenol monophosphomannose synthase [Anaerolineales bacterium]
MRVTVVLPTYNESRNLRQMAEALWALPLGLDILVVDDGSPDGTGAIAETLAAERPGRLKLLQRGAKLGLGTAYIAGFQHALDSGAEAVVQMDADFSHSPEYLPEMIEALTKYDVVVGSRYVPGGRLDPRWGQGRVWLSAWANVYARTLLGIRVHDATAGYKVWRADALRDLGLERIRSNGYVFQVEMAYVAERLGYRILEYPIYFEDRRIGQSKMSLGVKFESAWRVWQVGLRHRGLKPRDQV